MQAGRELDALVAGKVMGMVPCDAWLPINMGSAGGPMMMISYVASGRCPQGHEHGKCYSATTNGPAGGCPKFSTDIAAAWMVVEHLKDRFATHEEIEDHLMPFELHWQPEDKTWFIPRTVHYDGPGDGVEADTAPLAICLAALRAAGVEA